jgi:aspartyl-tRNA(Asn)/glutamyl-tRNA(Gln) amidotransferase subunit A
LTTDDLHRLGIAGAAKLIAAGDLSPVELTRAYLARIEALDRRFNSYVLVRHEAALEEARLAEREIAAGRYRGPLHGIPLALKDIIDTAGLRTTSNARLRADHVPARDAFAWAQAKAAGAILLGKLETQEFAIGGPARDALFPPARNPWDSTRYTGGSSSGSAAAVAAGLCAGAFGSDTNGSVRMPAARCGIVGLKPTYGRVSRGGIFPLAFSLDTCGPMTWSVEDSAILLGAMAGHDPADPASAERPVPDYRAELAEGLDGLRVGVARHWTRDDAAAIDAMNEALEASVAVLSDLGAEPVEVRLPDLWDFTAVSMIVTTAESYAVHQHDLRAHPEAFNEMTRVRVALGALLGAADYVEAQRRRRELCTAYAEVMQEVDVVVSGALLDTASRLEDVGRLYYLDAPMPTTPFNVTGAPALSVCCGFTDAQLPLAIQIGGRPFDEATVLRVGHAYERATPWRDRRPVP